MSNVRVTPAPVGCRCRPSIRPGTGFGAADKTYQAHYYNNADCPLNKFDPVNTQTTKSKTFGREHIRKHIKHSGVPRNSHHERMMFISLLHSVPEDHDILSAVAAACDYYRHVRAHGDLPTD